MCLQVAEKQEQTNAKPGRDKKDLGRRQLNGDQRRSIKQRACFFKRINKLYTFLGKPAERSREKIQNQR